ncbi:MAG: GtrA family protein [Streptosporangiales bacterium]|nr:GtrA family protein [Streptosporangiales bacterium]
MSQTPLEDRPSRPDEPWVWAEGSQQRQAPDEHFTGQSTSAQLLALSELKHIAAMQGSAVEEASSLLVRHPRNFFATAWRLRVKITLAGVNGAVAFLFGLGVQTAFISMGTGHFVAYVLQNIFSTQFSFLLARYITWRDRQVRFFPTLVRYNIQQISTTLLSIMLFGVFDKFGTNYALANFLVTLIIAPLAFLVAHKWSIAERETASPQAVAPAPLN